uniref:DELLA protein n=1 Tax=Kalanchoe fedtschenkoi TaxID=63787 RepID=A0A7N0TB54_KALFE
MAQYETSSSSTASSGSSSSCLTGKLAAAPEIDGQLAGAGYRVRSSELNQVAQRLERLETVMVSAPSDVSQLASDAVHYNPSDLAAWVDSLLSEFSQPQLDQLQSQPSNYSDLGYQDDGVVGVAVSELQYPTAAMGESWTHAPPQVDVVEEDSGIRLVHTLMTCAEWLQRGDLRLAGTLVDEMRSLLERVNSSCGIWKVAAYFVDALNRRVFCAGGLSLTTPYENEILYHHYYEACPYLKFAHFTANQAILEAFEGHDCVHVVDFNLMHGLQWPALIQALALRPGGPPVLRLTGIGPPSPDGRDPLREIGHRLAELARSVNVRFAFRGVAAPRLEDVRPWMLQVSANEAVAVNSIMQFHRLLASDSIHAPPIDSVLTWIRSLNPKIVTVIEQEANHNQPQFLDRFTEALYYYSTMFDSLEAGAPQAEKQLAEVYLQREICDVLCCEGSAREERHEPLAMWRIRFTESGFKPLHLGSNAFKQASMLLTLFSAEGYSVEENEGCLTLGWHSRPLISASAWHADVTSAAAASR